MKLRRTKNGANFWATLYIVGHNQARQLLLLSKGGGRRSHRFWFFYTPFCVRVRSVAPETTARPTFTVALRIGSWVAHYTVL